MVDFDETPFVAIWEVTRACDLACRHCRAEAISAPLPGELSTEEGLRVLDQLAEMGTPICVLSGGDPAKRADLCELISHGNRLGMRMGTIPAATPLLTRELVEGFKKAGLDQMALSLDGPTAEIHDTFRGTSGAFELTLQGARYAREAGLPLQINTTFSAYNYQSADALSELVRSLGVVFWEVFFLVPMGRGDLLGQMEGEQFERLFSKLSELADRVDYIVKITEAPHYRRFLMQREGKLPVSAQDTDSIPAHMRRDFGPGGSIGLAPKGVNSGKGHLFVSCQGDIQPSGFMPIRCGNVRQDAIAQVYRSNRVFRELRDAERLKGKCGICEYRDICGGSRARAYAMTGDYLEDEPFCAYVPADWEEKERSRA